MKLNYWTMLRYVSAFVLGWFAMGVVVNFFPSPLPANCGAITADAYRLTEDNAVMRRDRDACNAQLEQCEHAQRR